MFSVRQEIDLLNAVYMNFRPLQLRQLVTGLSPHRLRFNPRAVHVESVVDEAALDFL
jgi:hypothetical protein